LHAALVELLGRVAFFGFEDGIPPADGNLDIIVLISPNGHELEAALSACGRRWFRSTPHRLREALVTYPSLHRLTNPLVGERAIRVGATRGRDFLGAVTSEGPDHPEGGRHRTPRAVVVPTSTTPTATPAREGARAAVDVLTVATHAPLPTPWTWITPRQC